VPAVGKHLRALKLPEKVLLLVDNCAAHPLAETLVTCNGKISVSYLPKNTTSLIQPLDQEIIANFKKHYHRELVSNMIGSEMSVTDYLKGLLLMDFFYIGATAWNMISASTIEGCWMRGLSLAFITSPKVDDRGAIQESSVANSDNSYEEFLKFDPSEINKVNNRQIKCFRSVLAVDGITVSADDFDILLNHDESVPTTENLTDDEILVVYETNHSGGVWRQ
jgi:hypothetical protein